MGLAVGDYNARRPARPVQDPFRRRHSRAVPQPRQRPVRGRRHGRGSRRAESLRRVGRGHARPRQRRPAGPLLRDRQRLPGRSSSAVDAVPAPRARASCSATWTARGSSEATLASGPGPTTPHSSRGAAFGDFDNDGDVDVLVMNMNEPPSLLRNDYAGPNRWLEVKLEGTRIEPRGARRDRARDRRRAHAGAGRPQPVQLLLARRSASALRPGIGGRGGHDRSAVAERARGDAERRPRRPSGDDQGRRG